MQFGQLMVFGDSLSDSGRLFAARAEPKKPYYEGRFSNGPVAVEYLAKMLSAALLNFAWGGATTGVGNQRDGGTVTSRKFLPGMTSAFDEYAPRVIDSETLVLIWGGANDFLAPSELDADVPAVITRGIGNVVELVKHSHSRGARYFLVPDLPAFATAPILEGKSRNYVQEIVGWAEAYNSSLRRALKSMKLGIRFCDTGRISRQVVAKPEQFGFKDVSSSLKDRVGSDDNPGDYLFWDGLHPTTAAHSILAKAFFEAVASK